MTPIRFLGPAFSTAVFLCIGGCASSPFDVVASRFKYRVPFEIGHTQVGEGDRIEITELWGTRPQIEIGGDYLVVGKYSLHAFDEARVAFSLTARNWDNSGPVMDLRCLTVGKGSGTFALLRGMPGPGYFHVYMYGERAGEYSQVADIYFGTGQNLLAGEAVSGRDP